MKIDNNLGWGNILIHLCDYVYYCKQHSLEPKIDKDLKFTTFKKSEKNVEDQIYVPNIFINKFTIYNVHPIMRSFITFKSNLKHNCNVCMHIRRGKYQKDSYHIGEGDVSYHANDIAVAKFEEICEKTNENIFLASDSIEIKNNFKSKFGNKIITMDNEKVEVYSCDKNNDFEITEWYLLSLGKHVYITGGNSYDLKGFSTYGYTAAIYGGCNFSFVFNN